MRLVDRCLQAFRDRPWPHLAPPPPLVSLHRLDTDNLGDCLSSPALYFECLRRAARHDFLRVPSRALSHARVVVVGGGGLLDNEYFASGWRNLDDRTPADLIAWGLGHNRHGSATARYQDVLGRFTFVGVRDSGPDVPRGFDWVPCASCMHPAFDEPHDVSVDIVCYSHSQHPLAIQGVPRLTNAGRDVATAIRFLASADTVVTNTYHGMYWATLLGKRVVVFPYSSKFHGFRYAASMATADDWKSATARAVRHPQALTECREANQRFAARVQDHLVHLGV